MDGPSRARGGLEVWRAWDELLGRPVAVKLLTSARGDLRRAFREGVNRAAGLSHPALETVYDGDQTRDASGRPVPFVVTEFLDGETLAERLRHGPLSVPETVGVCAQIAAALGAAHRAGVTHGDLSPGKVMLVRDGVKVVDTGIGGIVRRARGGRQVRGPRVPGTAADVRALGAVISACLPAGASGEPAAVAARCLGATAVDGPSATEIAALLGRGDGGPPNAVFAPRKGLADEGPARATLPFHDHRTKVLRPPPPRRRRAAGVRLGAVALVVAIPVTAAVAILVSAPRTPALVPPPRAEASDAPGRLRPIVSRGYTSGEIRSDVAIGLNDQITNLETALASGRDRDVRRRAVNRRIALLRDEIVARQRERGLSPDVAAELNRALATIRA
ncbi:protein kinase [Actinomadura sp. KC216]|uniref:protein kinase n=1 Tax=Actinomadura sp. KC216 TaxID=2530370 RepID=UPI0014047DDB|nr:protein kinase [Actinomadura sp. KC216]